MNDRKLESSLESNINLFLAGAEITTNQDEAEIYSDFIVKEDGDFYSIDFMLTNDGQVEIISQDYEDEYYIMDNYTTVELKHHIVTVAIIKSDVIYKT